MGDVILDTGGARSWLELLAKEVSEHAEELTRLDAAIGDADHGTNMERGFKAVRQRALGQDGADPATIFKQTGMALISSVGGAGGPLYGTFFLRMAQVAADKQQLTIEDLRDMLKAGLEGVVQRGKASPGEKTMVDALGPAMDALDAAIAAGKPGPEALGEAADAADRGARETVPMVARKGRASYLGDRSAGHQDPGATSSALLLRTLAETVQHSGG
jgi:phosphoenolpyruvate---glycerone phosphotransferase subunit DhaL